MQTWGVETGLVRPLGLSAMLSGPLPAGSRMRVIRGTQVTELSPVMVLNVNPGEDLGWPSRSA